MRSVYLTLYFLLSASYSPIAIVTTNIGYSRKLLNLVKIHTNNIKYSSYNDRFTFKLVIFHNICLKSNIPPKAKMKAFFIMLKNLALDYYYLSIIINDIIINFN